MKNNKKNSIRDFDSLLIDAEEIIFTRNNKEIIDEILTIKKSQLTASQKVVYELLNNFSLYRDASYIDFSEKQKSILTEMERNKQYPFFKIVAYFYLALSYNLQGNYQAAIKALSSAQKVNDTLQNKRATAEIETAYGHIFSDYGFVKIANYYFSNSLHFAMKNNIDSLIAMNAFGLIKLYHDTEQLGKAKNVMQQIENWVLQSDNLPTILNYLRWQAEAAAVEQDWKSVKTLLAKFDLQKGEFFNPYFFIAIELLRAKLTIELGEFSKANQHFKEAISLSDKVQSKAAKSIVYRQYADSLIHKNKLDEAKKLLIDQLSLAEEMQSNIALSHTYHKLYIIADKEENFKDALYYFKLHHTFATKMNEEDDELNKKFIESIAMAEENSEQINYLKQELFAKNDELQIAQFMLLQKKQLINDVEKLIIDLKKDNLEKKKLFNDFHHKIKEANLVEKNKDAYTESISEELSHWSEKLHTKYPDLSKTEVKICYYTHKKLSNKEIASVLFTTVKNIEQHKYRIKKKMKLQADQKVDDILATFK